MLEKNLHTFIHDKQNILSTRKQNQNHNGSRSSSPLSRYCSNSKDHPRCNGIANWKRSRNGKIGWKGRKKKAAFPSHPFKRTSSPLPSSKKQRNRWELESKFRVNSIFRAGMADEGVYVYVCMRMCGYIGCRTANAHYSWPESAAINSGRPRRFIVLESDHLRFQ